MKTLKLLKCVGGGLTAFALLTVALDAMHANAQETVPNVTAACDANLLPRSLEVPGRGIAAGLCLLGGEQRCVYFAHFTGLGAGERQSHFHGQSQHWPDATRQPLDCRASSLGEASQTRAGQDIAL